MITVKRHERRKVVGEDFIITEEIKKERQTRNILTQKIIRTKTRCIKLDCGHLIPAGEWNKVPKNNTECRKCPVVFMQTVDRI